MIGRTVCRRLRRDIGNASLLLRVVLLLLLLLLYLLLHLLLLKELPLLHLLHYLLGSAHGTIWSGGRTDLRKHRRRLLLYLWLLFFFRLFGYVFIGILLLRAIDRVRSIGSA